MIGNRPYIQELVNNFIHDRKCLPLFFLLEIYPLRRELIFGQMKKAGLSYTRRRRMIFIYILGGNEKVFFMKLLTCYASDNIVR